MADRGRIPASRNSVACSRTNPGGASNQTRPPLEALSETGWHNYSLFLDRSDATLIGYFETPDLQKALDGMAAKDVNERWQAFMADYFEALDGRRPDEGFLKLENIFYLK